MIDPCRTTKFHAHFKPFHVVHAKYQPGQIPKPPSRNNNPGVQIKHIHHVPKASSTISKSTSTSTSTSTNNLSANMVDDFLSELIVSELRDVLLECQEESEIVVEGLIDNILEDVVNYEAPEFDTPIQTVSYFTFTDTNESNVCWSDVFTVTSNLTADDLIEDVVKKIMRCFEGKHTDVYPGQTSTMDCRTKDGEDIITDIITRLVATVQHFTGTSETQASQSCQYILASAQSSRETLKDIHKRSQFLLNHALDIAQVKLKLSGYSYLTWNIMEDCLKKGMDKLLDERPGIVTQLSDVEVVERIMEEGKKFLQGATSMMHGVLHGCKDELEPENGLAEQDYLEQLQKSDEQLSNQPEMIDERMLDEVATEGDIVKFAILLVKKTLHEVSESIPRRSSHMLAQALHEGNYDLAGSILAAKAIKVAHKKVKLDPQKPTDINLKDALKNGDIIAAGTLLANRAIQQAMNIGQNESCLTEQNISTMILEIALEQGDLDTAGKSMIESSLREALKYINTPAPEVSLDQALKYGDLEVAGTIMTDIALQQGLQHIFEADCQVRRDSSIFLEKALHTGDIPVAGDIIVSRLLRSGMGELIDEIDEELVEQVLTRPNTIITATSSEILSDALVSGKLESAAPVLINRALRCAQDDEIEESVIPMTSSDILKDALSSGNLETAAPVLANRALRSAQGGKIEESVIPMTSSDILKDALSSGNLETAAPVLANRALRSAQGGKIEESVIPMTSSDILKDALSSGNLETAAPVLANRALRSAQGGEIEESVIPMTSSDILKDALSSGNLETAAPVLANRALRSAQGGKIEEEKQNDITVKDPANTQSALKLALDAEMEELNRLTEELSMEDAETVHSVNSCKNMEIVKTSSRLTLGEEKVPTFEDGIYYLEALKKTNIDEVAYDRGLSFVRCILDDITLQFENIFENDVRNKCEILKPSLLKSDYSGAASVLVKCFLDTVRSTTLPIVETGTDITKFASLMSKLVFQSCLEIIRGGPGSEMTKICETINDHLRKTLSYINITAGTEAIISMVIGKCLTIIANSASKEIRGKSSIELFEACMTGDASRAGGILSRKVLKKAEDATQGGVGTFKSTDEILSEKHDKSGSKTSSTSETSIRSTKSKKKINTEGLPMPKPLSATKSRSSSNNYEPIRELLMSEEREFKVNQMVSNSERSVQKSNSSRATATNKSYEDFRRKDSTENSVERLAEFCERQLQENTREVGDQFTLHPSDEPIPQNPDSVSNESLGYVRKIQSKGHIYYINEDGLIKKRARRKRSSKKRLSQDDLKVFPERNNEDKDDDNSGIPRAVSSEASLLNTSPTDDQQLIAPKKSLDYRRSIVKKDSSLQVLAVINSSYTNMLGKKSSSDVVNNKESEMKPTSSKIRARPSIDEMLSETDKELIQKLSNESAEQKQADL